MKADQEPLPKRHSYDLTEKEIHVLKLLKAGHSKKEIARLENRAYGTIDTHFKHIYKKLKVNSAIQAVVKAIEAELI